jgi:hypothetical protein
VIYNSPLSLPAIPGGRRAAQATGALPGGHALGGPRRLPIRPIILRPLRRHSQGISKPHSTARGR